MILDTSDKRWTNYFTNDELGEIGAEKEPVICELPEVISNYLNNYKNLVTIFYYYYYYYYIYILSIIFFCLMYRNRKESLLIANIYYTEIAG